MPNTEEQVSKLDIEKLGIHFTLLESGDFEVNVLARLVGENHAYMTTMKVVRSVLEGGELFDKVFELAKLHLKDVLQGKVALNATV